MLDGVSSIIGGFIATVPMKQFLGGARNLPAGTISR